MSIKRWQATHIAAQLRHYDEGDRKEIKPSLSMLAPMGSPWAGKYMCFSCRWRRVTMYDLSSQHTKAGL